MIQSAAAIIKLDPSNSAVKWPCPGVLMDVDHQRELFFILKGPQEGKALG